MIKDTNPLEWLQNWYSAQCDGDWEHEYGVKIETVDNPGWYITINLSETEYENESFEKMKREMSEEDWYFCLTRNGNFEASCSPHNLFQVLQIFRNWIENLRK